MQLSSVRLGHLIGILGILGLAAVLMFWAPWSAAARADQGQRASNVVVNCEPTQQAVVRQTIVNGELNVAIQCAASTQAQTVSYVDQFGRPLQPVAGVARAIPAVYTTEPAVVSRPPATQYRAVPAQRSSESGRSWQKRALVLGGSAGAGAGIGGLIGGKKGALIGAALGGGGAALYEATRDR